MTDEQRDWLKRREGMKRQLLKLLGEAEALRQHAERLARAMDAIDEALDLRDYAAARIIASQEKSAYRADYPKDESNG